jgi:organic hydroperoxide reductase OsmC/OhrA
MPEHMYAVAIRWTGNLGNGTTSYRGYSRDHTIQAAGKEGIEGSADPAFRGDATRYNPEELLVASLSTCHMLWFLHKCCEAGIVVEEYDDEPLGAMHEEANGAGYFTSVVLRPKARFRAPVDDATLRQLHDASHEYCFVARSVNFPVTVEPR